jgi:hypothetical protein
VNTIPFVPICTVNIMLTLPDIDLWHDRYIEFTSAHWTVGFAVHSRLCGPPITLEAMEQAYHAAAGSLDAYDVSARKELAPRRPR